MIIMPVRSPQNHLYYAFLKPLHELLKQAERNAALSKEAEIEAT